MPARRPRPSVHNCARLRARARSPRVASRRSVGRSDCPLTPGEGGQQVFHARVVVTIIAWVGRRRCRRRRRPLSSVPLSVAKGERRLSQSSP